MQAERAQSADDVFHRLRVRNRFIRIRAARHLGRVDAVLAAHVIQPLGAVIVRLERLIGDRPGGRDTVGVLDGFEILAPESVQDAAPELRVPADAVVRIGSELATVLVEPALVDPVAKMFPDRLGIPVLVLLRDEVAALEDQDSRGGVRKRLGKRAAARAAADDDDVVVAGHRVGIRDPGSGIQGSGFRGRSEA